MALDHSKLKVFIDFDGTIITRDTGEELFRRYGNKEIIEGIIADINLRTISAREGWSRLFENSADITYEKIDAVAEDMQIRDGFRSFYEFAKANDLELIILSDGFSYYIQKILERENFGDLTFYSNKLSEGPDGKLFAEFPHTDEECLFCANCKRNHIISNSAEDDITMYIGNGSSDTCPVQFVDIIFARDNLLRFCEINRISYNAFDTFYDVENILKTLLAKKRIKKRRQAELKRKHIYSLG